MQELSAPPSSTVMEPNDCLSETSVELSEDSGLKLLAILRVLGASLGKIFLLGAGVCLMIIFVGEVAFNATGLSERKTSFRSIYNFDDDRLGPFLPDSSIDVSWPPELEHRISINSYGCRGAEPRSGDFDWIVCVGDSQTLGLGCEDEEPWPAILDHLLASSGRPFKVLNLSCVAWVIEDQQAALQRIYKRIKPRWILLLGPSLGYLSKFKEGRTPNERSRRREERRREWPRGIVSSSGSDTVKSNFRNWRGRLQEEAIGPFGLRNPDLADYVPDAEEAARFQRVLLEVASEARSTGAEILISGYPLCDWHSPDHAFEPAPLIEEFKSLGLKTVDPTDALNASGTPAELTFFPIDFHFKAAGLRVIAEVFAAAMQKEMNAVQ